MDFPPPRATSAPRARARLGLAYLALCKPVALPFIIESVTIGTRKRYHSSSKALPFSDSFVSAQPEKFDVIRHIPALIRAELQEPKPATHLPLDLPALADKLAR